MHLHASKWGTSRLNREVRGNPGGTAVQSSPCCGWLLEFGAFYSRMEWEHCVLCDVSFSA
jgi:hypothetical protein